MKPFLSLLRLSLFTLGVVSAPLASVFAQDPAATPDSAALPTPIPRPKPKPTPDLTLPVGTINGTAIYRPLMKSVVADPVDRALLIGDYNRRLPKLTDNQINEAVRSYKRAKFNNDETLLNSKLTQLGANQDDFRRFVVEETKLRLVLSGITRGSVSDESAQRAEKTYVAGLRQKASINQPKAR